MANSSPAQHEQASQPPPEGLHGRFIAGGQWSLCRMEHTLIEPVSFNEAPPPFHHLAVALGPSRPRMGIKVGGRTLRPTFGQDEVIAIEAGAGGNVWWDDAFESACFYFLPDALEAALGRPIAGRDVALRTSMALKEPVVLHLLLALHADAASGQPYGVMVGDAIFAALAARFVTQATAQDGSSRPDWRVRRALDYIHAHLAEPIDLGMIAKAAATSPYHLGRSFRASMGLTIWRYVLKHRALRAERLMQNRGSSLAQIAFASGFDSYSSFVAAIRQEFGTTPMDLRQRQGVVTPTRPSD